MGIGLNLDPLDAAPAFIALVVGLMVWHRHRADRRAQLFLALAISELAYLGPTALFTFGFEPRTGVGLAALDAVLAATVLVSSLLFFHFGMSFPHARPWLKRDRMKPLYLAAALAPLIALALVIGGFDASVIRDRVIGGILAVSAPLLLIGAVAACVAIRRSYREMTAEERAIYRAPVMGVLAGMIAGLLADLFLGIVFGTAYDTDNRYLMWSANLVGTTAALLLPLFFYTAAHRYRLLERHSQDYVSGPSSAR